MKFRTKLLMVYMVAAIGFTIILAGFFFHYGENKVRRSLYEQLFVQTQLVAEEFSRLPNLAPGPEVAALVRKAARVSHSRVTVIAADGGVIADSAYDYRRMPNHGDRPEVAAALRGEAHYSSHYSRTMKQNLLYVAAPLLRLGRIGGAIRLAKSQAELDQALLHLRWIIMGGVLLTLFFPLALASVILTRMTRPVLELQRLARRIGQGDLTVRVRFFGNDELAELGLMFNGMVKQLDESFRTIRDEKRKLEVILENLNDGILVIDRELKIMLANRAAQRVLGLASREIQGRQVLEAVLNHHLLALIQEVNRSKTTLESELTLHFPRNGQLQVFLAPLADQAGSSLGSIVVLHDLTRIRQLERVRQDFVANVSHELRTPITSIKAMTETLLGGAWRDNAVFMRYLEAIDSESDRLTNLINDLLALARLDAKQVTRKEAVDLVELIGEVRERFGPVKGRTPFFEFVEPDHPLPKVEANRDQIRQVLINLLDNAFKYTPADGQVRISCWQEADQLKVAVADTGIGIPREDQARIFERFYRVDKARSREIGGTGLGLAIVKHIIEAHGGRITVESAPNRGSVFSFTLPVA